MTDYEIRRAIKVVEHVVRHLPISADGDVSVPLGMEGELIRSFVATAKNYFREKGLFLKLTPAGITWSNESNRVERESVTR